MFNINGVGKNGLGPAVGLNGKERGKPVKNEKKDEKEKNIDKADFSSFMNEEKEVSENEALQVGKVNEKASGLSKKAEEYLEKLKKKYGNMDFIIQDYSTDEEADRLLSKGKGEYNVLITPALLEKMAADEETAAKYESMIDQSVESIDSVKENLGEDEDMVSKYGVTVDQDGNMSIRAILAGELTASDGSNVIKASTVEDMLKQLNEVKEAQAEKLAKLREERAAKEDETKVDTDEVDRDIKALKNERKDVLAQIHAEMNEDKRAELEALLRQLDSELAEKDNDSYRRSHSHFSAQA